MTFVLLITTVEKSLQDQGSRNNDITLYGEGWSSPELYRQPRAYRSKHSLSTATNERQLFHLLGPGMMFLAVVAIVSASGVSLTN